MLRVVVLAAAIASSRGSLDASSDWRPSSFDGLLQAAVNQFYGNTSSYNASIADVEIASTKGLPKAQFLMGIAYSTGLWNVERNDAKAAVEFYFAATGGDVAASMALGYKHMVGAGVPKNCDAALRYYEIAATRSVELREGEDSLSPVLHDQRHKRLKTVAESSQKRNAPGDEDVVEYYRFSSDKGDADATLNLALLYYYGARGVAQDVRKAASYFHLAYDLGATASAANLGHMYANGIGVDVDMKRAFEFFQEAAHEGNAAAQNGLATMYLRGHGVKENKSKAIMLFRTAAKQGNADAFYNLGVLSLQGQLQTDGSPEYESAFGYFHVAAQHGHTLSMHKVAHMTMHGIGTVRSCKTALDYMKHVAERGVWDSELRSAYRAYVDGDYSVAFRKYVVMAEQGYEVAQHNAAYMLEQQLGMSAEVALGEQTIRFYKAAAGQGNVEANLKLGDFFYYGYGATAPNYIRAMAHYSLAANRNAQASFNLGYMYEHGIGSSQDFLLAKRYYDLANEIHLDAYVPVTLALYKMSWHEAVLPYKDMEYDEIAQVLAEEFVDMLTINWSALGANALSSFLAILRFLSGVDMIQLLVHADIAPATDTLVMFGLLAGLILVWSIRARRRQN
ncbi:sel-1 family protein [Thraustotheca clavata]|uniref:Sel-1 family protein n=1 Tax=Thraustotheca clavata TaxID=74557 RepID=A0A1V9ZY78_9STRA|nr:sel-1 family protein [Thraustotheca clavata]